MQTETVQLPESRVMTGAEKSDAAKASSANARLNIPLNVGHWKHLTPEQQESLTWFHQFALDRGMSLGDCAEALNYDNSTLHRVLYGTYEGSWTNVCNSIKSYKRIEADRGTIQRQEFVENSITRKICAALSYALANNSITMITGESRMGKSVTAEWWRDQNNHGRSVMMRVPSYGGTKGFMRCIAMRVGVNKNLNGPQMYDSIIRAFNKNRILIVDEAHRMLPPDPRTPPTMLEILRDIHDETKCAIAVLATARFGQELQKSEYMFEQFLGRVGLAVRLPRKIEQADYLGIVEQYVRRPNARLLTKCSELANNHGRLGVLVEVLRVGSRMAAKEQKTDKPRITEEHVFKAIALRGQMMGDGQ